MIQLNIPILIFLCLIINCSCVFKTFCDSEQSGLGDLSQCQSCSPGFYCSEPGLSSVSGLCLPGKHGLSQTYWHFLQRCVKKTQLKINVSPKSWILSFAPFLSANSTGFSEVDLCLENFFTFSFSLSCQENNVSPSHPCGVFDAKIDHVCLI